MADTHRPHDRATTWLLKELPARAPMWLPEQRWFGDKTLAIEAVEVEDLFWLPARDAQSALVVLRVTFGGDPRQFHRYAMLVHAAGDSPASFMCGGADGRTLADAATQQKPITALLSGLVTGTPVPGLRGGTLAFADATARVRRLLSRSSAATLAVAPVGVEQSNTSVRLGPDHVFKLLRRLDAGDHPQLEVGRFLARAGFPGVPPLEGSVTYVSAEGESCAVGAVEGWIENSGDGWHDLVTCLDRTWRGDGHADELTVRMAQLGRSLAAFHGAMASDHQSPECAPEPVTAADLRAWQAALQTQSTRTLALVERQVDGWQEPASSLARRVLASSADLSTCVDRLGSLMTLGWSKIRIHGDFHLGQTLRTRDGYVVIDFEGEPTKPLAERRQKQSPLKDVAGMLRSLEYAVATVAAGRTPAYGPDAAGLRRAFVDAYCAHAETASAPYIPRTPLAFQSWLRFFELDKALYEVEYEANSRPTWVHIPLAAVDAQLALDRGSAHPGG